MGCCTSAGPKKEDDPLSNFLTIVFDKEEHSPNSDITGRATFNIAKPMPKKPDDTIVLTFTGREFSKFTELDHGAHFKFSKERELFKKELVFDKEDWVGKDTYEAGTHTIGFSFDLPADIASSYTESVNDWYYDATHCLFSCVKVTNDGYDTSFKIDNRSCFRRFLQGCVLKQHRSVNGSIGVEYILEAHVQAKGKFTGSKKKKLASTVPVIVKAPMQICQPEESVNSLERTVACCINPLLVCWIRGLPFGNISMKGRMEANQIFTDRPGVLKLETNNASGIKMRSMKLYLIKGTFFQGNKEDSWENTGKELMALAFSDDKGEKAYERQYSKKLHQEILYETDLEAVPANTKRTDSINIPLPEGFLVPGGSRLKMEKDSPYYISYVVAVYSKMPMTCSNPMLYLDVNCYGCPAPTAQGKELQGQSPGATVNEEGVNVKVSSAPAVPCEQKTQEPVKAI